MTLDEFEIALDDWGADLDLWPLDQRRSADELLHGSAAARDMLAAAQRLDAELGALLGSNISAPSGLADRIFAVATHPPYSAEIVHFPVPPTVAVPAVAAGNAAWWPPRRSSMVAAAAMVVCFVSGILTVQTVFPETSSGQAAYASTVHSSLDW